MKTNIVCRTALALCTAFSGGSLAQDVDAPTTREDSAFTQLKSRAQPFDGQSLGLLRLRDGPMTNEIRHQLAIDLVSAELRFAPEIVGWRGTEKFQMQRGGNASSAAQGVAVVEWSRFRSDKARAARFVRFVLRLEDWQTSFPESPGRWHAALILDPAKVLNRPSQFAYHDAEPVVAELLPHFIATGAPARLYATARLPRMKYDFDLKAFVSDSSHEDDQGDFQPRKRVKYPMFVSSGARLASSLETAVPQRAQGFALYQAELENEYERNPQAYHAEHNNTELAWAPDLRNHVPMPSALALDREIRMPNIPVEPRQAERLLAAMERAASSSDTWRMVVEMSNPSVEIVTHSVESQPGEQEASTLFARVERVLVVTPGGEVVLNLPASHFPLAAKAVALSTPTRGGNAAQFPSPLPLNNVVGDFLVAKYVPDAVRGDLLKGMFVSRLAYEQSDAHPIGGRFFNASGRAPNDSNLHAALAEYRQWLLNTARAMPSRLQVATDLYYASVRKHWVVGGAPGCATAAENTYDHAPEFGKRANELSIMDDNSPDDRRFIAQLLEFKVDHLYSLLSAKQCAKSHEDYDRWRRGGSADLGSGYIELPHARVMAAIFLQTPVLPPPAPPKDSRELPGQLRSTTVTITVNVKSGRVIAPNERGMFSEGEFPFRFDADVVDAKW